MQNKIDETHKNKKLNIMINIDEVKEEKTLEHNLQWLQIPEHPYMILIVRGSAKLNALLNQ